MKRILITAVALAACVGTPAFAQNIKQGVITFALTGQYQSSVSNSKSSANSGTWADDVYGPKYYKTSSSKLNTANILSYIGAVYWGNPKHYSSKAQLVLVQGELGGFFEITDDMADSEFNTVSSYFSNVSGPTTADFGVGTFAALPNGRHMKLNPDESSDRFLQPPVGHHQPWGQIYAHDPSNSESQCDDVTFFFAIQIQECYDCFYLNSFISDATFSVKPGDSGGPPCCSAGSSLTGTGKDRYYMALSFDNTQNNPYLNENSSLYTGYAGLSRDSSSVVTDGLVPDFLPYIPSIKSGIGRNNPYIARFTLNGIVTYTWSLKFINKTDLYADFIGSASYPCNGYGFIALFCGYLNGTVSIAEKALPIAQCCTGMNPDWSDLWYAPGWNSAQDPWEDYFESPINTEVDLSIHAGFDEDYKPARNYNYFFGPIQQYWPDSQTQVSTQEDGDVFVPVTPALGPFLIPEN